MADTLITTSLAQHVAMTPADTSVTVVTGTPYMISLVPSPGYRVKVVTSEGLDVDWSDEDLTVNLPTATPALQVNVLTAPTEAELALAGAVTMTRYFTGEAVAPGKTEADTFFTDAFIRSVMASNSNSVLRSASRLWRMKAAEYARLIDLDESGSVRKLTQRFRQAKQMSEDLEVAAAEYEQSTTGDIRVAGRVVNLRNIVTNGWRVDGEFFDHGFDVLINEFTLSGLPPLTPSGDSFAPI